jgi:hypothetical protein
VLFAVTRIINSDPRSTIGRKVPNLFKAIDTTPTRKILRHRKGFFVYIPAASSISIQNRNCTTLPGKLTENV